MKAVGARLPRYDGIEHVTGRTVFVDDVKIPGCPVGEGAPLARAQRDDHEARHVEGGGDEGRRRGDHVGGRAAARVRAPVGARDPGRRAAAREGRGALQGPADRARRRRGRGDRTAAVDAIELELEERPTLFDIRRAFDDDAPMIHPWGNWYPHFEAEMDRRQIRKGDIDAAFDAGGRRRAGCLPAGGDRARARSRRSLPGRARGERPAHDLLLHAGALLLARRRRRAPAAAAHEAEGRRRHRRRRLRRQGRHRDRDDVLRCWR